MEAQPNPSRLDFSNTEFAFSYQSDRDLKRTHRLFRMMDSPFLSRLGPPFVSFCLKIGLPVQGIIRKTIFDVFCGGTSLPDTQRKSEELYRFGVSTILDYSVEGEKSEKGFEETAAEIIRTIEYNQKNEPVAFSAMKVSGIADFDLLAKISSGETLSEGEKAASNRAFERFNAICKRAHELREPVFVDAEESWIQPTIDHWTEEMMATYNHEAPLVYTTTQMYRHDRLEYLKALVAKGKNKGFMVGVKVVRGAYLEKENERAKSMGYPTPMQPDKGSTDRDYDLAIAFCMANIERVAVCAGTHNAESSLKLAALMHQLGIPNNHPHVVFAQLLGMSDNISFNLGHHGYRVAKYLPYGPVKAVLPYLFRRAAENTSIAGQSSRELQLLKAEMKRRKLA
jgi:proline dehydrogenase